MAKPRVFVSSTFYDLRQVRADLEQFILSMGYEPILNERGTIPYGSEEKLEEYCYREIEIADILISIVGGRLGSASQHAPYSVSQMELKTALKHGKQAYIFVERSVLSEFNTYKRNKDKSDVSYASVDDSKVYEFLVEVSQLPNNNPISPFETARDITEYLRDQWAGLFQHFLQEQVHRKEVQVLEKMETTAQTLDQLVNYLTEERRDSNLAIHEILLTNHPIFARLRKVTNTPYRLFFSNHNELAEWLQARSYAQLDPSESDDPQFEEWMRKLNERSALLLGIKTSLFDADGRLRVFTPQDWEDEWVTRKIHKFPQQPTQPAEVTDEDIPF